MKKLKPYPSVVCWSCANPRKKLKGFGCNTVFIGSCGVCRKLKGVSTPGDYGWPDFAGFTKVKRPYVWD